MDKFILEKRFLYLVMVVIMAGNVFVWQAIIFDGGTENLELWFLDVGQGDSQLINLPNNVQILIDGGKGPKVLNELAKVLKPMDRYIDLVVATHPDFDHFGGLIDVLKTYQVGAVITNGRKGVAAAYADFEKVIQENGIQEINLIAGDKIKYEDAVLDVLWPLSHAKAVGEKKVNETGIVLMLEKGPLRALYTADIGFETERELVRKYDLSAQILKVAHHGSKYSTSPEFLKEVQPKISLIGVGKNNYGHPTNQALNRLANIRSQIFRTDQGGAVKIIFDGEKLKIFN
ncbi:MAG: MBL fold metallo-hydrolase [Patescibacteria group bacterium]